MNQSGNVFVRVTLGPYPILGQVFESNNSLIHILIKYKLKNNFLFLIDLKILFFIYIFTLSTFEEKMNSHQEF